MAISATFHTHHLPFLPPTTRLRRHNHHHTLITTTLKPYTIKARAALLPQHPIISKTLLEKVAVSFHEFKGPLLALANAVAKWVDLYHSVLMVRILLSWFPNMPWEKQPFSAIRDLCDPCLSFFRSVMPPTANKTIDLSPILAFVFFGVLSSFLKTTPPPPGPA
ncbi:hypothetical protein vseg_020383 [Gypsophila vaccaria]